MKVREMIEWLKTVEDQAARGTWVEHTDCTWSYDQVVEQPETEDCGHCGGTGRMVRDDDIGTDQECFVCDGNGKQMASNASSSAG